MTGKFTPSLQELALVRWLLGDREKRFAMFFSETGTVVLYERVSIREEDGLWSVRKIHHANPRPEDDETVASFGGKLKVHEDGLRNAGLIVTSAHASGFPEVRKRFADYVSDISIPGNALNPGRWPHNAVLGTLTDDAAEWWETTGRPRYEKLHAKLAEKKKEAAARERVAVFGARRNYEAGAYGGEHAATVGRIREIVGIAAGVVPVWRGMRPAFSAIIVRETETRYYVRDVKYLSSVWLRPEGGHGRNVEQYIDKERLILDNATADDIARLQAFDAEMTSDYTAMRNRLVDELVPALSAALDRKAQKDAEIDGTFDELLSSLKAKKREA